ncbi:MAG TPA: HD domain-containing protein [Rectinemataceae bacterium]|nr:HD domain-containing protein [Rectinemataceae bacterium]
MRVKGPGPDELVFPREGGDPALGVWMRATRLKRLFRQGWLKRGIEEAACESVADHSFGVALLALLLAPSQPGVLRERAVLMALVHELGEAYAGDITPVDGVSKEEKARLERDSILRVLEGSPEAAFVLELWEEYEATATPTARFVKELDRLEMGLEASVHEAGGSAAMGEFHDSARRALVTPNLRAMLEAAIAR